MMIHEYGSRDNPTLILLAPMMVSGLELYAELKIRPEYAYCGYMAAEPQAYVKELEAFIQEVVIK